MYVRVHLWMMRCAGGWLTAGCYAMNIRDTLNEFGGAASYAELRAVHSRREIERAVDEGKIVRVARGRFVQRVSKDALLAAQRRHATVAVESAAQMHGWPIGAPSKFHWISVPRGRKLTQKQKLGVYVIRTAATGIVTQPLQTVLDSARHLRFPDALAIADSALRAGDVGIVELLAAARGARGPGATRIRRVAEDASLLAASPLESVLRGVAIELGMNVVPQMSIELPGFTVHPDLVDPELRIIIEGDTWFHHASTPDKFNRDVQRYTMLVAEDWLVLRFIWQHAMLERDFVERIIGQAIELRAHRRTKAA